MAGGKAANKGLADHDNIKAHAKSPRTLLVVCLGFALLYLLLEPYIASRAPIFVYSQAPYVTDVDGVPDPTIRPGDTLIAHFDGNIRRRCDKVTYLRHFVRINGDFERIEKVPPLPATYINPGRYHFSVAQETPKTLYTGRWVWRAIELAECYEGHLWRSERDMPFTVIGD